MRSLSCWRQIASISSSLWTLRYNHIDTLRSNHEHTHTAKYCRTGCNKRFAYEWYRKYDSLNLGEFCHETSKLILVFSDHEVTHSDVSNPCDKCGTHIKRERDLKRHQKHYCLYGPRLPLSSKEAQSERKSTTTASMMEMDVDDVGNIDQSTGQEINRAPNPNYPRLSTEGFPTAAELSEEHPLSVVPSSQTHLGGDDELSNLPDANPELVAELAGLVRSLDNSICQVAPRSGETYEDEIHNESQPTDSARFAAALYDRLESPIFSQMELDLNSNNGLELNSNCGSFQTALTKLDLPVDFGDIWNTSEPSDWHQVDETETQSLRSDHPKDVKITGVPGGTGAFVNVTRPNEQVNSRNAEDQGSVYDDCDDLLNQDPDYSQYIHSFYSPEGLFDRDNHPA